MVADTYDEALGYVLADEGGYSNDAGDDGGPTNFGITIHDARRYWKPNASAADVRGMPKAIAKDIYAKHYATPLRYNELPAGVDYTVLDFGINSGLSRAVKYLQRSVGVAADGVIGPATIAAAKLADQTTLIARINDDRLIFLHHAHNQSGQALWPLFGRGWDRRVVGCKAHSLAMAKKYGKKVAAPPPPTPAPKAPRWQFWKR